MPNMRNIFCLQLRLYGPVMYIYNTFKPFKDNLIWCLIVISEHYQVKRTCTDNFDVNFFMVNHACMTEGHRHGHMCFCEEDECNAANAIYRPNWGLTLLTLVSSTLFHILLLLR